MLNKISEYQSRDVQHRPKMQCVFSRRLQNEIILTRITLWKTPYKTAFISRSVPKSNAFFCLLKSLITDIPLLFKP